MSLIYGVPEMAEEEVLEQIAFQAVQYLRLDDPKYKKADTLSKILVAAKDKPKEDEIVYIEALESIIGENGSYKDLGDAKVVDKSWDTEGTQFNITGFQACACEFNGEINVCLRGTPAAAGIDNGYGMAGGDYLIPYENAEQGVSNLGVSPMQHNALEYMQSIVDKNEGKVINISGHSKGGNLSVYASVKCDRNIQKRIVKVYSNDGPGFSEEMIQSKEYQRMLPKIKTILPESSIVGMLLEHQEKFEVVKSSKSGIQQHDAMSWEVLGSHFVYVEEVAPQSILLDETMKKWIFQLTKEQREEIVDTVFSMLDDAKIYTVDDFYNSKWKKVQELMKAKSKLSPETQELFSQALRMLWKTGNQTVKKSVKQAVLEKVEEANSLFSNDKSKKSMKSSKK